MGFSVSMRRLLSFLLPLACLCLPTAAQARVALVATTTGNVAVIDLARNQVTGTVNVSGRSTDVAVSADGSLGYVTSKGSGGGLLTAIDMRTRHVLGQV